MIAPTSPARLVFPLLLLLPWSGCLLGDDEDDTGREDGLAMEEGTAAAETAGEVCFEPPDCDPLSSNCGGGEVCTANGSSFTCMQVPAETQPVGEGEACNGGISICEEGLVCVSVAVTGCSGGTGCCLALCDLQQPQCPMGTTCTTFFGEGTSQCYEDVGVCTPA